MYPSGAKNRVTQVCIGSVPILRMFRPLRTESRVKNKFETLREEHKLVARAFQSAEQANARRILLASARTGDGKSEFARCIERYAHVVSDQPIRVCSFSAQRWQEEPSEGFVWVDGVALLEGGGAAALTPAVREHLDGALLIARGMVTTREQLRECAERLRVLGMPVLGGVWNDVACRPPLETLQAFVDGFRTWPPKLPPGVFVREARSSS